MNSWAFAVACAAAVVLAGCADTSTSVVGPSSDQVIPAGKGAITGLLIDDRYRPVGGALVLVQSLGLTTTTDAEGQFRFLDLLPGVYLLRVQVDGHEAAPVNVDVQEGVYSEVEVQARRVFSIDGSIITNEYSVFSPCMQSGVLVSSVNNFCMPDSSGDTYRPGITVDLRAHKANLTYLISEILLNQPDRYVFVVRCADGSSFGCGEYAYVDIKGGTYGKLVMQNPGNYMHTPNSLNWTNKALLDGLLFFYGTGGDEITPVAKPVGCQLPPVENPLNGKPAFCRDYYGAGAKFGVKAKIVMTAFLGTPTVDVATYNVLGSGA